MPYWIIANNLAADVNKWPLSVSSYGNMPRTPGGKKTAMVAQNKTSTSVMWKTTKERSGSKSSATAGNKRQHISSNGATQEKEKEIALWRQQIFLISWRWSFNPCCSQVASHPRPTTGTSVLRLPEQLAVAGPETRTTPVNPLIAKAAATANCHQPASHQPASQETTVMRTSTTKSLVRVIAYRMRVIALLASMHMY